MSVAPAATTTLSDNHPLIRRTQVTNELFIFAIHPQPHFGSKRNGNFDRFSLLAVPVMAITSATIFGNKVGLPVKLSKSVNFSVGDKNNVAAVATIATARAPTRKKCLSYERHNTVTTITGSDFYYCGIKHVEIYIDK
jgi:hypothetical protein